MLEAIDLKQTDPLTTIRTLQKARDIALRYLASCAGYNRNDDAFVKRVRDSLPDGNPAERIFTAVIVVSSPLVLHEMQSYLDSGTESPAVDSNAENWLN